MLEVPGIKLVVQRPSKEDPDQIGRHKHCGNIYGTNEQERLAGGGITLQSADTGESMGGSIGWRKPLRRTTATPPSERHHLNKPNATSAVTWPTSKPRAHERLRKVSSSRNRQLTVHLYMNTRDRSKAFCKYARGSSAKNDRASTNWVTATTSRWRMVSIKPWRLKRITRRPGRYNKADIFTDNARLVCSSVPFRYHSFNIEPTYKSVCPSRPRLFGMPI